MTRFHELKNIALAASADKRRIEMGKLLSEMDLVQCDFKVLMEIDP